MNTAVEKWVKPVVDKTVEAANNAVTVTRQAAHASARLMASAKQPLQVVTDSSLKLNKISHQSIARLVNVQSHAIEGTVLAAAKRLETAANAHSVNELVNDQMAMVPASRERLVKDARQALDVLSDTRDELRALVNDTVADFGRGERTSAAKARTATRRTATKAKRKAATAKRTVKKAAKKTRKTATKARKKVTR